MKYKLFCIFLFICAIGFSQSSIVKVEIDTTNIRIGEQFQYKISVNETENVILPKLKNLKGLEIIDSLRIDTINNKLIKKYILTGFDSGAYHIPQQQIFIKNQAYLTDSLLVNVVTIPVDTTKQKKFAIKGIKGEPYQFDDYKSYVYWALAILLIAAIVLYFALKRTDTSESKTTTPLLAPYQEALRSLKLLDGKLLWQNNKIKPYYSELTDIIRHYIERELNVPALEQTTDELVDMLTDFSNTKSIITDTETIHKLEKLLQQSDLVKFAKSKPMAHEIEADRNFTEHIINNLKPSIVEESSETIYHKPVEVVQKPIVKKPAVLVRVLLVLLILAMAGLLSYGISKAIFMSNAVKPIIENVE